MRALVTGASRGIGRATAFRLAEDGFDLVLHYHRAVREAEDTAKAIRGLGREAHLISGDLGSASTPEDLHRQVAVHWDSLDVLVHNAGEYPRETIDAMSEEAWRRCIAVNLSGPALLTKALLPMLRRAPHPRIVFVASVLAFTGSAHGAHYAAAKGGIVALAKSLARELAPTVRVNTVAPGSIETAIIASDSPEVRVGRERATPLGRVGQPDEVADAIAFLVSERSSYITGTTLHVNGGIRVD